MLGTVDRPQLHDVMLDYVHKQLVGAPYKAAQRRLVELIRASDRSSSTQTGKYMQQCVRYHINESHDGEWAKSDPQATHWLEDHLNGSQNVIASATAAILPVEAMAMDAEANEMWWRAALRWNAFALMKIEGAGDMTAGNQYLKRAINASSKAIATFSFTVPSVDVSACDRRFSEFDIDSFDLHGINLILKAWDPADLKLYTKRLREVVRSEAGIARPVMRYAATLVLDWFPPLLRGDQQAFSDENWKLSRIALDLCDSSTDAYTHSTEEDRERAKPLMTWTLFNAGDAIMNTPGFDWDYFGVDGEKLVLFDAAYKYEVHHNLLVDACSFDVSASFAGGAWVLTLQYGRVEDAKKILTAQLVRTQRLVAIPANQHMMSLLFSLMWLPILHHIHGLSDLTQKHFATLEVAFDTVEERVETLTKTAQGVLYTKMDHKGVGGGLNSLIRCVWQIKALCILNLDVPRTKAVAWLEALPDNEEFYAYSMTFETFDHGAFFGWYQACWLALAHEKYGLFDGAIRFADLQLEPDLRKAGMPLTKWALVIAAACKGRALAKLARDDEALAAFQTAIAISKKSYSLMEAFAYRELANYDGGGSAAVQAASDMETKLGTFKGRMTRADFDTVKISY